MNSRPALLFAATLAVACSDSSEPTDAGSASDAQADADSGPPLSDVDVGADAEVDTDLDDARDGDANDADVATPDAREDATRDAAPDAVPALDLTPALAPLGGAATAEVTPESTFSTLIPHLPLEAFTVASRGRELFVADWEPGDGGRELLNGLGPLFHVASCAACHPGTGRPAAYRADGSVAAGVLFRLRADDGPDPVYGGQLQPNALPGVSPEATLRWYDEGTAPDDVDTVSIGARVVAFEAMSHGPLDARTRVSPRLSPQLIGMGHLDLVSDEAILAWADPDDADGDGISGRPNWLDSDHGPVLGRYGWKANAPSLRAQVAGAFVGDMGLTSPLQPTDDCSPAQTACAEAPNGGEPEVDDAGLDAVVAYLELLAVPARAPLDEDATAAGYETFVEVGCASCHRPTLRTGTHPAVAVLSDQAIHPFTDLLLHDMGEALADGVPDGDATGREWRTAPLWGIGRVALDPDARFLHDGRAATIDEAIRAHGGEAAASATAYAALDGSSRAALLAFLSEL